MNTSYSYYLRVLKNGVGYKYLIHYDDYIKYINKRLWFDFNVTHIGISWHSQLGALLEVDIDVSSI